MSTTGKSDVGRVLEMINGYQQTCLVVAGLQLGLFERLAKSPATVADLARELGANGRALSRLVRALRSLHLFDVVDEKVTLTSGGKLLVKGGFGEGMRAWATLIGDEYLLAWANLRHSVMTGENAFGKVFGMPAWEHRKQNPHLNECFNAVTSGVQLRTLAALLTAYDFSGPRTIVDVGGGHGNLVAGVLKKNPEARGIVFDQPHVVEEGAAGALAAAGVSDRCTIAGGSFLESVPAGGDVYLLKHVLHNWDDEACTTILRNCRAAMGKGSLLVLENVVPDDVDDAPAIILLDIHMMAIHDGRERTRAEYEALFDAAGLKLERVIATREGAPSILEAKASAGAPAS